MSDIEEFLKQHEQLFDFTEPTKLIKNFIKIHNNKKIVIVTSGGTSGS
jgi:dihydrodipicolinate reductase